MIDADGYVMGVSDDAVRGPLWEHPWWAALALMRERRHRFGYCPNDIEEESAP